MKKNSSFKLRSGNKPSPTELSGVSPMKNDKTFQDKIKKSIKKGIRTVSEDVAEFYTGAKSDIKKLFGIKSKKKKGKERGTIFPNTNITIDKESQREKSAWTPTYNQAKHGTSRRGGGMRRKNLIKGKFSTESTYKL
jgi:hypothetical protein